MHGYGYVWLDGKYHRIHKMSYKRSHGEIPDGYIVRHKCDNPSCWNPEHLELGTQADNMKDMVERGRSLKGSSNLQSKLNEAQVLEIKELLKTTDLTQKEIAKKYDVNHSTISLIKLNKKWKHVEKENK